MKNLHKYLAQKNIRAWILIPPLTICVIGIIIAFMKLNISSAILYIFIAAALWMLLGMMLILWSDSQRNNNNQIL